MNCVYVHMHWMHLCALLVHCINSVPSKNQILASSLNWSVSDIVLMTWPTDHSPITKALLYNWKNIDVFEVIYAIILP